MFFLTSCALDRLKPGLQTAGKWVVLEELVDSAGEFSAASRSPVRLIALREVPSYHSAIVTGSIPLFTALIAAWRGGRRQTPGFWCAALAGSALVASYGVAKSGWVLTSADLMLLLAPAACGIVYAEGAKLGAEIGKSRLA